ncbi:MAG TPA: DUF4190 domain-containing protein [Acidimicrobiales bacterium]|nr:DUF4190 domain-containing protein [Acidimicrobiales bacterium]
MSDTSQGPGWWLASDGKWYPPETWTGPTPQAPQFQPPQPQGYGAPPYAPYGGPLPPGMPPTFHGMPLVHRPTNGLAVASLVCSCVGIVPFLFGLPCLLGIIFGFVARSQIKNSGGNQAGDGLALAGIIVGFSLIAIFIIAVILIAVFSNSNNCFNGFNSYNCSAN